MYTQSGFYFLIYPFITLNPIGSASNTRKINKVKEVKCYLRRSLELVRFLYPVINLRQCVQANPTFATEMLVKTMSGRSRKYNLFLSTE